MIPFLGKQKVLDVYMDDAILRVTKREIKEANIRMNNPNLNKEEDRYHLPYHTIHTL